MPPLLRTRLGTRLVTLTVATLLASGVLVANADHGCSASRRPGIDISCWQSEESTGKAPNWNKIAETDVRFVIARASRGTDYDDEYYEGFVAGAQSKGIWVTAYHYAKPNGNPVEDAKKEAAYFIERAHLEPGMLIPALDVEQTGLTPKQMVTWITVWLRRVEAATGVKPMIYTSPSFWRTAVGDSKKFARNGHPLWIANWHVKKPDVPAGNWAGRGWTFWQWTNCRGVTGIRGCVDGNRYNGKNLAKVAIEE